MVDKHDLFILPRSENTSLVLSEAGVSLIARGRREASSLLLRKKEPLCLAAVKVHDAWGFIDKECTFVISPNYPMVGCVSESVYALAPQLKTTLG